MDYYKDEKTGISLEIYSGKRYKYTKDKEFILISFEAFPDDSGNYFIDVYIGPELTWEPTGRVITLSELEFLYDFLTQHLHLFTERFTIARVWDSDFSWKKAGYINPFEEES